METEDVERVSAVTTVPGLFPECTTEFYTDSDGEKAVRVSYKEDAGIIYGKTHTEYA